MSFPIPLRLGIIIILMLRSYSRKSLTTSGIIAAVFTGIIHSITNSSINLALLIAFFITGTVFTKLKSNIKKSLTAHIDGTNNSDHSNDKEFHESRNHIQVLANSIVASVLIILQLLLDYDYLPSIQSSTHLRLWKTLQIGIISQYAAVTADTWSSELGILSKSEPILITTLKPCPKGTNGGVSKLGLIVAVYGGLLIGLISSIICPINLSGGSTSPTISWTLASQFYFSVYIGLIGLFGSILDSILGALFQKSFINNQGKIIEVDGGYRYISKTNDEIKPYSGLDILSNNQVNLIMAVSTSSFTMLSYWYFS